MNEQITNFDEAPLLTVYQKLCDLRAALFYERRNLIWAFLF